MPRRIEIELTSDRGDGSWTWRAAGAKQPKGALDGGLLPSGAKPGDVFKVEAEFDVDGITVVSIPGSQQRERKEPTRLELLPQSRGDDQLVTTSLVPKGERSDRDRRDRRPRGDRPDGDRRDRADRDRPRGQRPEGDRRPRGDRPDGDRRDRGPRPDRPEGDRRPRRPAPPPVPERPKPKRLRPGRTHRRAVLGDLAPELQPIAEEVLKGGIPAVRAAIDAQNEKRTAAGETPINAQELLDIAERLLPLLRTADWRDRAEAALAEIDELDLKDLRSVVVASENAARDEETRAMAAELRTKLDERVDKEHQNWLEDLGLLLDAGRVVRALRLASRPPKTGTPLAPELRARLVEGANASMTSDITADRWAAVLEAVSFSPVRTEVVPQSVPEAPGDDVLAAVRKYASRVPKAAAAFGIEAPAAPTRAAKPPRGGRPDRRTGVVPVPKRPVGSGALGAPKIPPPPPRPHVAAAPSPSPGEPPVEAPVEAPAEPAEPAPIVDDIHEEVLSRDAVRPREEAAPAEPEAQVEPEAQEEPATEALEEAPDVDEVSTAEE
jgi:hypothetical protein